MLEFLTFNILLLNVRSIHQYSIKTWLKPGFLIRNIVFWICVLPVWIEMIHFLFEKQALMVFWRLFVLKIVVYVRYQRLKFLY